jgi:Mg-chelatase subunit ChlD
MQPATTRLGKRRGMSLLVGSAMLMILIPLIGLAIDSGYLYVVKAKLQASVDGASLSAARALNLGQTTDAQRTAAQQNASMWFHANFPDGTMGSTSVTLATPSITDDPVNPKIRNVGVSATATVSPFFMGMIGVTSTTVAAMGNAARRDVVVVLVLDQSGSMNSNNGCSNMRMAAKLFTGQFAAGRDQVGLVTFSDTVNTTTIQAPGTNFQTVLGYSNASGSATGIIDNITCVGGTSPAQAMSVAYKAILAKNLVGALNVIMVMTDGLPNFLTLNFRQPFPGTPTTVALKTTSPCKDTLNLTMSGGGDFINHAPNWTPGVNFSTYFPGSTASLPAGMIATVGTNDTLSGSWGGMKYLGASTVTISSTDAPGCSFSTSGSTNFRNDISWLPDTDTYGNGLDTGYKSVSRSSGHITTANSSIQNASFNATDEAANTARTGTIPTYVFAVGLGGTTGSPPDYQLMQRLANDPNGDLFNSPALYSAVSLGARASQPQGTFIFSSSPTQLSQAFLKISSMILRLSQ